jgi:hypothetical protein
MTHILFFAALLALPLFGLWTWRLNVPARIAVAGAAGALTLAVAMAVLSLVHVPWTRITLLVILGASLWSGGLLARRFFARSRRAKSPPLHWYALAFLALTAYGALTARESAGDLHFFWGPKAIHFANARGIDVAFLANTANPNPDYPPLLPLIYAWADIAAGGFSWLAAVLSGVLFLAGSIAIVRGFSGDDLGTLLFAATMAWCYAVGYVPGGADPPLLFFETLTLCALTFLEDSRDRDILTAIGLAGAAFTKVEGATFVIAVVIAMLVLKRKRVFKIAAPAFALIAAWLIFIIANGLAGGYGGAKTGLHLSALPEILRLLWQSAQYRIAALPWIVPLLLLFFRRAALPLLVALLTLGTTVFFYLHTSDPGWWISASAPRVLLTPLTALLIAVLQSRADGVVPERKEA